MTHLGSYYPGQTVDFEFNTVDSTRALVAMAGSPALAVWKDGGTTEFTTGLTLTEAFDTTAGFHRVVIDTSNAVYTNGSFFTVGFTAGTVDSVSVVKRVLRSFRIEEWPGVIRRGSTATATATTLTMAAESAPGLNIFAGCGLQILTGTGSSQFAVVASNTNANPPVLTFDRTLVVTPSGTITYVLWAGELGPTVTQIQAGLAIPGDAMTLTAAACELTADTWSGRNIEGGSNSGRTNGQAIARLRNRIVVTRATGAFIIYAADDTTSLWTGTATFETADDQVLNQVNPA